MIPIGPGATRSVSNSRLLCSLNGVLDSANRPKARTGATYRGSDHFTLAQMTVTTTWIEPLSASLVLPNLASQLSSVGVDAAM